MLKLSKSRKAFIVLAVIIAVIIASYATLHYRNNQLLTFQAYAPTVLPASVHVTGHAVSIDEGEGEHFQEVSITTNVLGLGIGEEKSTPRDFAATTSSCSTKMTNASCVTLHSPKGQAYDVQTIFDRSQNNKPTAQTVSWLRGNTRFFIQLRGQLVQKNSDSSWGSIIDSFKPVPYGSESAKTTHFSGG